MKLKLYKDEIILPSDLDVDERMILAEQIINENPESFNINGHDRHDRLVMVRLDILGTYILNAVKDIRDDVLSRYKIKRRPYQERPISNIHGNGYYEFFAKLYSSSGTTCPQYEQ